ALLLKHLRRRNLPVLAMKPFSSGDRNDAELFAGLQAGDLSLNEINPFFFSEPLAPLVAARKAKRSIEMKEVIGHVRSVKRRFHCLKTTSSKKEIQTPILLIEGVGGLLVPLGRDFSVLDLIQSLRPSVVVVAPNKLGTINHSLLTLRALQKARAHPARIARSVGRLKADLQAQSLKLVLVNQEFPDPSASSNAQILRTLLAPIPVFTVPFFPGNWRAPETIEKIEKKIEKTLAQILR